MSKKEEILVENNVDPIKSGKNEEKARLKAEKKKLKEERKAMKKANTSSESKVVICIVTTVLVLAFSIFGFYFYKSSFEVIAKFDGGSVTKAEYDVYYKTFASILSQYYGYPDSIIPEEIAKKAAIDKVIVKLAEEAGTTLSDKDQASLDEIFNNDEYVQSFVSQGMDIEKTKDLYYNDYLITQYLADLQENIDAEILLDHIKEHDGEDADLNEYKTSHILIKTVDDSNNALSDEEKANAKSKAEGLLARALAGEDFATLAKENSEDSGTASEGGVYVCYDDGSTVDEYIKAVKSLEVGSISPTLVETSYGYHIIKLDEKVQNGRTNSSYERELYVNEFTDGLEEKYNVKIDEKVLNNYIISVTGSPIPNDEEDETTSDGTITDTENTTEE